MLLVISPLDIVSLKHGSDDFKCNAVVIPTSILNNLFADVDISKYESLKNCRIVLLEDGFYFYFVQAIALLKSAKQLVSQEKFNLVAEKQVVSLIQMLKHYNSTFQSNVRNERKEYSSRKNELFKKFIHELISSHSVSREVLFYANELGVSCGYLNEVCNEVSSHSAKEIIDSVVAARLKYELSYTGKTIQELSDEYNFPSQSYFSRYYKRMTGMSPSEFRKKRQ
jgi:AraC-like DNA-binding protein